MFRVRRGPNQSSDISQFQDNTGTTKSGVDVNGNLFGDARRLAGIIAPEITTGQQSAAAANAAAIQAALDSATPGSVIRLPNDKFYCNQINITGANSGITIEGGPNTLIINSAGGPLNERVFVGFAARIGYINGVSGFTPGDPGVTTFEVSDIGAGGATEYFPGDVMYLWPVYSNQPIEFTRLADMHTVGSFSFPFLTLTAPQTVSTTLGASLASATVKSGQVTDIIVVQNFGTPYYRTGPDTSTPRVHISGDGSGAAAVAYLDAPVASIAVTVGGSGYTSTPSVAITSVDGFGTGAAGFATVDPVTQAVTGVVLTAAGSGYRQSPNVTFGGPGSGAAATATIGPSAIASTKVTSGGSGYASAAATFDPPQFQAKWVKDGSALNDAARTINSVRLADPSLFLLNSCG